MNLRYRVVIVFKRQIGQPETERIDQFLKTRSEAMDLFDMVDDTVLVAYVRDTASGHLIRQN